MQTIRLRYYDYEAVAPKVSKWLVDRGILRDCYHIGFDTGNITANGIELCYSIKFVDSVRLEGADLTEFMLRFGG